MGEIGADDDEGFGSAPQALEQAGDEMGVNLTDRDRQDLEVIEG